jgi:hypothetical protein
LTAALPRIAVGVVALGASAHLVATNQWNLRDVFTLQPFDTSFDWKGGPGQIAADADSSPYTPDSPMLRALVNDRSFYTCYESLQLARGAGADRPLVFDEAGRVADVEFSPNSLTFTVREGQDGDVILNQNWAPGWSTTLGEIEPPRRTELARVRVAASTTGRHSFHFTPPGFYTGLIICGGAILASLVAWRRRVPPIFEARRPR